MQPFAPFEIRKSKRGDAEAVHLLLVDTWRATYADVIGAEKVEQLVASIMGLASIKLICAAGGYFIAIVGGEIAGVASGGLTLAGERRGRPMLWTLYVHPRYQGRGIGKALLDKTATALAARSLDVEVLPGNSRAIAFYEREGFVTVGMNWDAASTGEPALVMSKELPSHARTVFRDFVQALLRP